MPALVILLLVLIVSGIIFFWEKIQEQLVIAKILDKDPIEIGKLQPGAALIVSALLAKGVVKRDLYRSQYVLPGGNVLSFLSSDLSHFIRDSSVNLDPTILEWRIFRALIRKYHSLN